MIPYKQPRDKIHTKTACSRTTQHLGFLERAVLPATWSRWVTCKVKGEIGESFRQRKGVRHCVMSPWLLRLFIDRVVKENAKVGNVEVEVDIDNTKWKLNTVCRRHCFAGNV